MKYQYWKCSVCNEEFRTSTEMGWFEVRKHLESHPEQNAELHKEDILHNAEVRRLDKKYPKRSYGYWIKNVTPPVKRKLWKCPICKEEMSYYHKYYHQANATRNGKPYACIPKKR